MIITIIFICVLVLGIIISHRDYGTGFLGIALVATGLIFLITDIILIIVCNACADYAIERYAINYEGLCKRYEIVKSEYEDISESDLIQDITEWNSVVYSNKHWSENPWTNWFFPQKIADNLDYISLDEKK